MLELAEHDLQLLLCVTQRAGLFSSLLLPWQLAAFLTWPSLLGRDGGEAAFMEPAKRINSQGISVAILTGVIFRPYGELTCCDQAFENVSCFLPWYRGATGDSSHSGSTAGAAGHRQQSLQTYHL